MKIILVEPQIPQNTGNIVRTASVTGCSVMLVSPGFSISDKHLKRAGLDYWEGVEVQILNEVEELVKLLEESKNHFYFFSSKTDKIYSEVNYKKDDWLIFGSESSGLPQIFLDKWPEYFVTMPMKEGARCLNLATTVGIAVFEALRQQEFITLS